MGSYKLVIVLKIKIETAKFILQPFLKYIHKL